MPTRYRCDHCGGYAIYVSFTWKDKKGTLSCINCGNTADAKGITRIGEVSDGRKENRKIR
jgi:transcription elongation factor Elf1